MCSRRTYRPGRLFCLIPLVALAAAPASAGDGSATRSPAVVRPHSQVRVGRPVLADALWKAVAGAAEQLEDPRCQPLFDEFADASGDSLASVLDARGETAREHLARLFFYAGDTRSVCRSEGKVAATEPGNYVILVCPAFAGLDPLTARAVVIHELLHTLGLGENPPSSQAITRRVVQRCWS